MTLPSEALQIATPDWRTGDTAMLEEMANRFMEEQIAPHYERYEKQEMFDREAWEKSGRGRIAVRVHARNLWRCWRNLCP